MGQPGTPIGECVGAGFVRVQQGLAHALTKCYITIRATDRLEPRRGPEAGFFGIGAGVIAARGKWRTRCRNFGERLFARLNVCNAGRVLERAYNYKVVVHHIPPINAVAIGYKLIFL